MMTSKHTKRCLTLLVIMEMQIKMTIRYHYTHIRKAKFEYMKYWWRCGATEQSSTFGGYVNVTIWKKFGICLIRLNIHLPYTPGIPFLFIKIPESMCPCKDFTPIFIAAASVMAKNNLNVHQVNRWTNCVTSM